MNAAMIEAIKNMKSVQIATNEARRRTQDKTIATQAKNGMLQVIRVTYNAKGKATIVPVTDFLMHADAVEFLGQMQ